MPKKAYEAPVIRMVGSLHDLTLVIQKQNNNASRRLRIPRDHPDLVGRHGAGPSAALQAHKMRGVQTPS